MHCGWLYAPLSIDYFCRTYRGNTILDSKFSKLSSIWGQVSAIYLDDQLSSVRIAGNVFDHHQGMILELGGGRHNEFTNNVINGTGVVHFDDRGGHGSGCCDGSKMPFGFLDRVPYNTSKAWKKYPGLANILADAPCEPKHNVISDNILCGGLKTLGLVGASPLTVARYGSVMANNTEGHC